MRETVSWWRRGFLPASARLYDFAQYPPTMYLPDLAVCRAWSINEPHVDLLNDKVRFHATMADRGWENVMARTLGTLGEDVSLERAIDLIDTGPGLAIKPPAGGGGTDVHVCRRRHGQLVLDGARIDRPSLRERLASWRGHLVTEYCEQAAYAESIFPHSANTIRMLTMRDDDGEVFPARTVHRFGTSASMPVDNFSRGGMVAPVDSDGTLGSAVISRGGRPIWTDRHPVTDELIAGTQVPGWEDIRSSVLTIAKDLHEMSYVGWDILVTGSGKFRLLEANANSDVDLIQVHGPLLVDDRVRSFYSTYGLCPSDVT